MRAADGREQLAVELPEMGGGCRAQVVGEGAEVLGPEAELGELELEQPPEMGHTRRRRQGDDVEPIAAQDAGQQRAPGLVVLEDRCPGGQRGADGLQVDGAAALQGCRTPRPALRPRAARAGAPLALRLAPRSFAIGPGGGFGARSPRRRSSGSTSSAPGAGRAPAPPGCPERPPAPGAGWPGSEQVGQAARLRLLDVGEGASSSSARVPPARQERPTRLS